MSSDDDLTISTLQSCARQSRESFIIKLRQSSSNVFPNVPAQNLNIQPLQQTTLVKAEAYLDGCAYEVFSENEIFILQS